MASISDRSLPQRYTLSNLFEKVKEVDYTLKHTSSLRLVVCSSSSWAIITECFAQHRSLHFKVAAHLGDCWLPDCWLEPTNIIIASTIGI